MAGAEPLSPSQQEAYNRLVAALAGQHCLRVEIQAGSRPDDGPADPPRGDGRGVRHDAGLRRRLDQAPPAGDGGGLLRAAPRGTSGARHGHRGRPASGHRHHEGCGFYLRSGLLDAPMNALATYATAAGKRLIFGSGGDVPAPLAHRCYSVSIGKLTPDDYRHLCTAFLGDSARGRSGPGKGSSLRAQPQRPSAPRRLRHGSRPPRSRPMGSSSTCGP